MSARRGLGATGGRGRARRGFGGRRPGGAARGARRRAADDLKEMGSPGTRPRGRGADAGWRAAGDRGARRRIAGGTRRAQADCEASRGTPSGRRRRLTGSTRVRGGVAAGSSRHAGRRSPWRPAHRAPTTFSTGHPSQLRLCGSSPNNSAPAYRRHAKALGNRAASPQTPGTAGRDGAGSSTRAGRAPQKTLHGRKPHAGGTARAGTASRDGTSAPACAGGAPQAGTSAPGGATRRRAPAPGHLDERWTRSARTPCDPRRRSPERPPRP